MTDQRVASMLGRALPALLLGLGVASAGVAMPASAAEPAYNVCETQILRDVRERFGTGVERIEFTWDFEGGSDTGGAPLSTANVFPARCPGFYFYEIFTTYETCVVQPHYGQPPDYAVFVSANDGC